MMTHQTARVLQAVPSGVGACQKQHPTQRESSTRVQSAIVGKWTPGRYHVVNVARHPSSRHMTQLPNVAPHAEHIRSFGLYPE